MRESLDQTKSATILETLCLLLFSYNNWGYSEARQQ